MAVNLELRKYKTDSGSLNYPALFDIPVSERLPAMAKRDLKATINVITVALTLTMEAINISRPMSSSQVVDLAEVIVDSFKANDNISMEDFMLFLQKLTRGEYPELYEGMDQVKFMSRFDTFRDERWEAGRLIYEERHKMYKEMGDSRRVIESTNPLDIHAAEMSNKIQALKDQLKEQKDINKRLREDF